ncbi:Xaa-Pro aminopeptidase [Phycisphaerae bacterium RAS1]|nr:Xaa-Pro aminopeptidase [Phycisphaerae bacterium RAS1]
MSTPVKMPSPPDAYRRRRAKLASHLKRPLVVFAGHAPSRNYAANVYPLRPSSTYLYFGGPFIEHAAWLITPGSDGDNGCTLFRPVAGPDDAVWLGPTPSDGDYAFAAGVAASRIADLDKLEAAVAGRGAVAIIPPFPDTIALAAKLKLAPLGDEEIIPLAAMRVRKDEHELAAMRYAAEIGCDAHRAAMAVIRPEMLEADVAAEYEAVLVANQCRHPYTPIITIRGEVLHGNGHPNMLDPGAMLLMDAGAEEPGGYATDITRVVPVNGQWTTIQRHIYDAVLRANRAAIEACTPGRRFREIHFLAARVIAEGLAQAELLVGDPAALVERNAHALFFTHGLGHLIGLDVHDLREFGPAATYAPGRQPPTEFGGRYLRMDRDLEPGMTLTIEPGIYLTPEVWERKDLCGPLEDVINRPKIEALLAERFGGIRIEHTVCVRAEGAAEILTDAVPTDADEVLEMVGIA